MKQLFLKLCRWILPLLGISGVVGCDSPFNPVDMYGCPPLEYGTPVMDFRVSGKVTDSATDEPIKGIAVTHPESFNAPDTVWTAADGTFSFTGNGFPSDKVRLKFTDVDDDENGGLHMPQEADFELQQAEKGDGSWNSGFFTADNVKVTLEKSVD